MFELRKTMKLPRISVVVPSCNQVDYLEEALVSVIGQEYPDPEIIVMDGGSEDGSVGILEKYSSRLAHWESKPDNGQTDAINRGFARATGDVFCWLNSDDLLMPGALLDVGRRLAGGCAKPRIICGPAFIWHDSESAPSGDLLNTRARDPADLKKFNYLVQPSCFWTRALFERTGPLDEKLDFVMDWEWFIRASEHAAFEFTPRPCSFFRMHESNKTGTGGDARRKEILDIVDRHAADYWRRLYHAANDRYQDLKPRYDRMKRRRIPRARQVFLWMNPGIKRFVRHGDDLVWVMEMLQ